MSRENKIFHAIGKAQRLSLAGAWVTVAEVHLKSPKQLDMDGRGPKINKRA